ncbi:hypothetical protein SAMN04487935_3768 [Flavobacterium noncentrifugens]|uniref:Uncharacterized protein n=1 Tax=Flavobacterium noncentrifugens TaxID=1128970 RepID=A0A1G9DBV6_9FLAO|nr:hypothetical protein SAMN04487935_3768 [Flavobacterium noncentrifugens]
MKAIRNDTTTYKMRQITISILSIAFVIFSFFVVFIQFMAGGNTIVIIEELLLILFLILILPINRSLLLSKISKQSVNFFILFLFLNLGFIFSKYINHRSFVVEGLYPYDVLMQIAEFNCLFILYFIYSFKKNHLINNLISTGSYIIVLSLISANIYIKLTTEIINYTG